MNRKGWLVALVVLALGRSAVAQAPGGRKPLELGGAARSRKASASGIIGASGNRP